MKTLPAPSLALMVAIAAALFSGVACGPESFDRSRHKDAGLDTGGGGSDGGGPDESADDGGGDDMGPVVDADLDAPPADDGGDGGGSAGDANDGGATDATDARDSGPVDAGCRATYAGDILHVYDTGATVFTGPVPPMNALPPAWFAYADTGSSTALSQSTTGWNATEGRSCAGALTMTANFTIYAPPERVMALYNFNANWAAPKAYTHLHAWVKIVAPSTGNLDHVDGLQLATNTNNFMAFRGMFISASTFVDFAWHEVVMELIPGTNYVPTDVRQIGVQIIAKGAAPTGGPAAPVPTTLLVDDIWLEVRPPIAQ